MKRIILLSFLLVSLVACSQQTIVAGNHTVLDEASRLAAMASRAELKMEDLAPLEQMIKGDGIAEHNFEEAKYMVQFNEQEHALHALGALAGYLESGKPVICPGHDLAHYYLFIKHDQEHEAEHALEHAQEHISEWVPLAQAYDKEFPGTDNFAVVQARINDHLSRIESGDLTATDEEINILATRSICVEE